VVVASSRLTPPGAPLALLAAYHRFVEVAVCCSNGPLGGQNGNLFHFQAKPVAKHIIGMLSELRCGADDRRRAIVRTGQVGILNAPQAGRCITCIMPRRPEASCNSWVSRTAPAGTPAAPGMRIASCLSRCQTRSRSTPEITRCRPCWLRLRPAGAFEPEAAERPSNSFYNLLASH
jgi:hypothetical protein